MKNYEIFTGAAGTSLDAVDLRADSSVVLNLLGLRTTATAVELQYDMTFAPEIAVGNQRELGLYLDRVQTAGVSGTIQPTFTQLVFEQSPEVYADFLTQLGADFYAE